MTDHFNPEFMFPYSDRVRVRKSRVGRRYPSGRRYKIWLDNPHCHYCDKFLIFEHSTLDHKVAVSKGGRSDADNLLLACRKCNRLKSDMSYEDFMRKIENKPKDKVKSWDFECLNKEQLILEWWMEYEVVLREEMSRLGKMDRLMSLSVQCEKAGIIRKSCPMPRTGAEEAAKRCDEVIAKRALQWQEFHE